MNLLPARWKPSLLDERFARHQAELLGFLRRRVGADAEEVAQDTWLRVTRAHVAISDEVVFRAFLFTVARRLLIDRHRRAATRPMLVPLADDLPTPDDPAATAQARETMGVVECELGQMKAELAEVFRLRTSTDASFADIARRQGVGLNTALGRMHQATRRIAAALAGRGLLPGGEE